MNGVARLPRLPTIEAIEGNSRSQIRSLVRFIRFEVDKAFPIVIRATQFEESFTADQRDLGIEQISSVESPLFSSGNSPRNTATPLITSNLPREIPPITSSCTTCQPGTFVAVVKSNRVLCAALAVFMVR